MHAWYERARRATLYAFSLFLITALGSGCGIFSPDESNEGGGGGGTVEFQLATTPSIMIDNFEKSWENLNILEYEEVLHPDFYFWFSPDDLDETQTLSWSRSEEIDSVTNMFSGQTGEKRDPDGNIEIIPAILSFEMTLTQQEPWSNTFDDGEEFAGADFRSRYNVSMTVRYTDADRVTKVDGEQMFYAKRVPTTVDGQNVDLYQIFAWKDLGNLGS